MALSESSYMISYMSIIEVKLASLIFFEIFAKNLLCDLERSKAKFVNGVNDDQIPLVT